MEKKFNGTTMTKLFRISSTYPRLHRETISKVARVNTMEGNGAGFAAAPVSVISGAGVVSGAGVLLVEDVGVGDCDLFKGQSIVVIGGVSVFKLIPVILRQPFRQLLRQPI